MVESIRGIASPNPYFLQKLCELFGLSPQELGLADGERSSDVSPSTLDQEEQLTPPIDGRGLWSVPYQRNPYFTGRDEILQQLHTAFSTAQQVDEICTLALSGLGGIGKTQIAIEYAYRYRPYYSSICWLDAETQERMYADLIALAEVFDLPERHLHDHKQIVSSVLRWLASHQKWLLIIDNVQEIELIKGLLPRAYSGSLLFTTRLSTFGTLAKTLYLKPLNKDEGISFLIQRSGQLPLRGLPGGASLPAGEYEAAEQLYTIMNGLPLALDQAGANIEKAQSGISDFLDLFQRYPMQLLHERTSADEHPISIAKTLLLSFERLQQANPTAADLLIAACMFPLDALPEELFIRANQHLGPLLSDLGSDELRYRQTLQDLLAYSLVRRLPDLKSISIHQLVRFILREQLAEEVQRLWAQRLLLAANDVFPPWKDGYSQILDIDDWPSCQRLLLLILACEQFIEQYQIHIPEVIQLLTRAADYLASRAQYSEAEALATRLLKLSEAIQGGNS